MKNKLIKVFIVFIFCNLFFLNKALAASLTLESPKSSLGLGEQFYVDLRLDPANQNINTIKGQISFTDENVTFLRIENNKSIVPLWPEEPTLNKNVINFAGVIPNGFAGLIDPFNPSIKSSDLILRLVFQTKKVGQVDFSTTLFYLNLNDGLGTVIQAEPAYLSLNIDNFINNDIYENVGVGGPELEAYVTRDPNIYNNKYILVFRAYDKESGIKNVILKEGWGSWQEIKSPYLLHDQARHSDISLQATSNSGGSLIIKIDKIPYDWRFIIVFLVLLILVIYIWEKRRVERKKHRHL